MEIYNEVDTIIDRSVRNGITFEQLQSIFSDRIMKFERDFKNKKAISKNKKKNKEKK